MAKGKIKIFIHVVPLGSWLEVCISTLNKIKKSGLFSQAEIYFFLNHDQNNYGDLIAYLGKYPNVTCFHLASAVAEDFEIPSIRHLKIITDSDSSEQKVLYLHLKGITHNKINQIDWRNFMEWGCIENWRNCIEMLDSGFDTAGVNFMDIPTRHYSGNIWWTTSSHIRKLPLLEYPHLADFKQQVHFDNAFPGRFTDYRLDAEFWVCSIQSNNGEFASSASRNSLGWHYGNYYPLEEYYNIL